MINYNLNIPVSLYKEMGSIEEVTPKDGWHYHEVKQHSSVSNRKL